jgi:hypothetical protein
MTLICHCTFAAVNPGRVTFVCFASCTACPPLFALVFAIAIAIVEKQSASCCILHLYSTLSRSDCREGVNPTKAEHEAHSRQPAYSSRGFVIDPNAPFPYSQGTRVETETYLIEDDARVC